MFKLGITNLATPLLSFSLYVMPSILIEMFPGASVMTLPDASLTVTLRLSLSHTYMSWTSTVKVVFTGMTWNTPQV